MLCYCSHFWVIAMKLGTAPLPANPLDLFRDNASFVLYSSDVVAMEPYVTAEISMSRYDATRTYLLGSLESNVGLNDNAKYLNGPLNQSTTYTVLVWGFSPVPLVGAISMLCCCCCCCCHYTTVQCPLLLLLLLSLVHYSVLCCYCYTCCTFVVVVVLVCCCCCCYVCCPFQDGSSGQRAKRQSTPVRQYGAFSSTPFLTPITTSAEAIPGESHDSHMIVT